MPLQRPLRRASKPPKHGSTHGKRTLSDRISVLHGFVDAVTAQKELLAKELSQQMGRPIRYTAGEIGGFEQRAKAMLKMAPDALADIVPPEQTGFRRFVRREPLGVVLVLSLGTTHLTAVNAIVPALAAGNTVISSTLSRPHWWPSASKRQRMPQAYQMACFRSYTAPMIRWPALIEDTRIGFVAFTGSVEGGQAVTEGRRNALCGLGLELGGKDPAYVRADANFRARRRECGGWCLLQFRTVLLWD